MDKSRLTLLAVNANTILVIKSALATAKRYDAPIIFITTLNQVDLDGEYTGWNQYDFVKIVLEESKKKEFDTLKRLEQMEQNLLKEKCFQASKFMKVLYNSILESGRWRKMAFQV